jgi:hypothetical protein
VPRIEKYLIIRQEKNIFHFKPLNLLLRQWGEENFNQIMILRTLIGFPTGPTHGQEIQILRRLAEESRVTLDTPESIAGHLKVSTVYHLQTFCLSRPILHAGNDAKETRLLM